MYVKQINPHNKEKIQSFQTLTKNWSIRYRGNVPRIIINQIEKKIIFSKNIIFNIRYGL